jgi:hypothetical protein
MKSLSIARAVVTGAFIAFIATGCGASTNAPQDDTEAAFSKVEWQEFIAIHQPIVENVLEAYNAENAEAFAKSFIISRQERTERSFKFLWVEDYREEYGDFISKEFFSEKSNPNKIYPLLTYKAKFEKNDEVGVRCVFAKDEDGKYRIFYLRMDPYQDLFY